MDEARAPGNRNFTPTAAGHLHDRQQRIEPLQRGALHRHPEDGKDRVRRDHARQVRGASRPRDDHLDAARFGRGRELRHPDRRPVRRDDVMLVRDAEPLQHIDRMLHRLPVRR